MNKATNKPLGMKCYGSIPHLPGSRRGPGDHGVSGGQARICLEKARDKHDKITITEKLDGSNVGVAMIDGILVPLIRAGYPAVSSSYEQHHLFHDWVISRPDRFGFLHDGHRVCGEWLAQAHGTRYHNPDGWEPFVAFDIMIGQDRLQWADFIDVIFSVSDPLLTVPVICDGPASIEDVMLLLDVKTAWGSYGFHGAADHVEGAVWRVERKGKFDFMAKYVRPDKVDGSYLLEMLPDGTKKQKPPTWNWRPS